MNHSTRQKTAPKICIIGVGEIGSALKKILEGKGLVIDCWDKDAARVPNQQSCNIIVPGADFLFLCTPAWAIRDALVHIIPSLSKNTIVISLAKGIDGHTKKTMDEVLGEMLPPKQPFSLLAGPMLAEELMQGMVGSGIAAATKMDISRKIHDLFRGTNLMIEYGKDIHGVALASILKNIYAIGLGMANGLGWGDNQKGWFCAVAVKEMSEIIEFLGGKKITAYGIAGLGDLIATGYSPYSRNQQIGNELVRTGSCQIKSEGVLALPSILALLDKNKTRFLLLNALQKIIIDKQNAREVFQKIVYE